MTVRVFLAASISMFSSLSRRGGIISRSLLSSHLHLTPMLSRTSIIRLTSSIRATRRRVVLPLFSRLAQSRPTAAFLLVFVSILPWSFLPPFIRKLVLPLFSRLAALSHIGRLVILPRPTHLVTAPLPLNQIANTVTKTPRCEGFLLLPRLITLMII